MLPVTHSLIHCSHTNSLTEALLTHSLTLSLSDSLSHSLAHFSFFFLNHSSRPCSHRCYLPNKGHPGFGELGLLYNKPRAASVIAVTDCKLWTVDRWTFSKYIMASMEAKKALKRLLRTVPLFSCLSVQVKPSLHSYNTTPHHRIQILPLPYSYSQLTLRTLSLPNLFPLFVCLLPLFVYTANTRFGR